MTTTLQDLQSAAGVAVTAGGTLLPMRDVIRLASQSHHYLVIYDKHTSEPLYCGRAKRFATPGQRIVLHAKDRIDDALIPSTHACGHLHPYLR